MSHLSGSPTGPRVAVVLSGCGYLDGSEINETVIALLALNRAGARVRCFAPAGPQLHVVDHLTGQPVAGASRDILHESARITRGKIEPLSSLAPQDFEAIFLPGGFGAAKNLSSFATQGPTGAVLPELAELLRAFRQAGKPIGAVCIAPAVVVMALGEGEVTIGQDSGTAAAIEALGGRHQVCPVQRAHTDHARRIVTAPAFMEHAQLAQVADGIEAAVAATLSLVR
jgi:enhancing lycopene biosynthesis protein 2